MQLNFMFKFFLARVDIQFLSLIIGAAQQPELDKNFKNVGGFLERNGTDGATAIYQSPRHHRQANDTRDLAQSKKGKKGKRESVPEHGIKIQMDAGQ